MPAPLPRQIRDITRKKINRAPSPAIALSLPWLSVMFGSLSPAWPIVASAPVMPAFGFLMLVAWQQLRPGLFPVWAGLPLGLFDDLYSGQPMGSAVLLWSLAMIVLDVIETRFPWRGFVQDWLAAAVIIVFYLLATVALANLEGAHAAYGIMIPQLVVSLLAYPLVGRIVAAVDKVRLYPLRAV